MDAPTVGLNTFTLYVLESTRPKTMVLKRSIYSAVGGKWMMMMMIIYLG